MRGPDAAATSRWRPGSGGETPPAGDRAAHPRARPRWRRVLIVAARTLVLSLVTVELTLRFLRPVEFRAPTLPVPLTAGEQLVFRRSTVPGLAYEVAPNVEKLIDGAWVRTNSLGLRGPEPSTAPGVVRVAVLGDSFTFALGVPVEQGYPAVLQRMLDVRAEPGRYDVLNFGVPGYSTWEEAIVLERRALPMQPRTVIVGYFLNDPETEPLQPLHVHFHPVAWWQHFHALRLVALLDLTLEMRRLGTPDYYAFLHAPAGRKWPSVPAAFDRIRAVTAPAGIPVLVVIFPANDFATWAEYRYADLHGQAAMAAAEAGLRSSICSPPTGSTSRRPCGSARRTTTRTRWATGWPRRPSPSGSRRRTGSLLPRIRRANIPNLLSFQERTEVR